MSTFLPREGRPTAAFDVELSTARRDQDFEIRLEIPEGETVDVRLNGGASQFIVPSDRILFTLPYAEVKTKHRLLGEDIAEIVDYGKRTIPPEELFEGLNCVVRHAGQYWRGILKSFARRSVVKCLLVDSGALALVHTRNVFPMFKTWAAFEPRVLSCRLAGLSAFANSFHLLHILKHQIDWAGDLKVTVTKGGVTPIVLCSNSTYPNETLNQVILNYLYLAYDPRRLLQLHQRWPDTLITSNSGNGQVSVQLDTPLLHHLQQNLRVRPEPIPPLNMAKNKIVYLGLFEGGESAYQRITIRLLTKESSGDLEVHFIDTGIRKQFPGDYPLRLIETLPDYSAITRIPPLSATVKLNNVESIPEGWLGALMANQIQCTIEQVEKTRKRGEIPLVEVYEQTPGLLLHLNGIFQETLNPTDKPHLAYFHRQFSSCHNWSMPLIGNNWGKGSERVFDLVPGTTIYGIVTHAGSRGYFYIRPLDLAPLPLLDRGIPALEPNCGCLLDGEFFRLKTSQSDEENVRVRLRPPFPPTLPHVTAEMEKQTVPVYFLDQGTFGRVPSMELRKMGDKSAVVPPQVALAHASTTQDGKWTQEAWDNFARIAVGKTLHLAIREVSYQEPGGYLALDVKILSRVMGVQVPPIPESEQTEEEW